MFGLKTDTNSVSEILILASKSTSCPILKSKQSKVPYVEDDLKNLKLEYLSNH